MSKPEAKLPEEVVEQPGNSEKETHSRFFLVGDSIKNVQEFESQAALNSEREKSKVRGERSYQLQENHPAINIHGNESGLTISEAFDQGVLFFENDSESPGYGNVYFQEKGDVDSTLTRKITADESPTGEELLGGATMEKMS